MDDTEVRVRILAVAIALEGLKEYDAGWLKNAKTVVRDASGRFASKAADVKKGIRDAATESKETIRQIGESGKVGADAIGSLVQDKDFRKRAGLEAGMGMSKIIDKLSDNPWVEEKLSEYTKEASQKLAEIYGEDNSAISQALRKSEGKLPEGKSFRERLERGVALAKVYEETLKSPEKYSKQEEVKAEAIAAAVPVAVSIGIALLPEVAIPIAMAGSLDIGAAVGSVVLGQIADFAVNKTLDAAHVEDPFVRMGASLMAGSAVGGLSGVRQVNSELKKLVRRTAKEEAIKKIPKTGLQSVKKEAATALKVLDKDIKKEMKSRLASKESPPSKEEVEEVFREFKESVELRLTSTQYAGGAEEIFGKPRSKGFGKEAIKKGKPANEWDRVITQERKKLMEITAKSIEELKKKSIYARMEFSTERLSSQEPLKGAIYKDYLHKISTKAGLEYEKGVADAVEEAHKELLESTRKAMLDRVEELQRMFFSENFS